ncbi:glutamate ligase domain-containing protein [Aphanothece sacrum]|uniref:tetrahydrofolate synthase n=1 Tax=Aphanothece sacrum FPU1 TaxID=1920663 RepID=A0A401IK09_APHSA|nr:Mur ligase family protein [Aphanothece sacrum]GBF81633.1 tetrahydrofolate synthase [Aphanothece sacrum FPU1]GBF84108.1 tetrahydrofolate synthase [Aphanothece sacrum FPU3]
MNQSLDQFNPNYLVALDEIYHSNWVAKKKRQNIFFRQIINHLWPNGHPTKLIQITGTNGKGSVSYYLEQGLQITGKTSGSWTGPHIFDYAERFHINGQQVSHNDIILAYQNIQQSSDNFLSNYPSNLSLTFPEIGILMTLHLFEKYEVDWGIMEVGCGGRYTDLMALDMVACVLTNVGNDHPKTLGSELWQRALDKAGIARPGVPFFTSEMDAAKYYVMKTAEAQGAKVLTIEEKEVEEVEKIIGITPQFKLRNLTLACQVIRYFYPELNLKDLLESMKKNLPGRFANIAPNVIVDVAHNSDKIARLADQLSYTFPGKKFTFLIGLTRERNIREVFAPILPLAKRIVITGASYAGQNPELLAQQLHLDFANIEVELEPKKAYEQELKILQEGEILILTGSAYMIDQAINPNPYLRHLNATYGWRNQK